MHWFDPLPPVKIRIPRGMRDVSSVEAELEVMRGWVRETGLTPEIAAAYPICYGAIAEVPTSTVEDAREAFILAAGDRVRGE